MEWAEINAAWGQTALLLWSLARKVDITFNKYQVVPYGSYSYMKSLSGDEKTLPLYGSGGFRMIFDSKFDSAMVAFLDCLRYPIIVLSHFFQPAHLFLNFQSICQRGPKTWWISFTLRNGQRQNQRFQFRSLVFHQTAIQLWRHVDQSLQIHAD